MWTRFWTQLWIICVSISCIGGNHTNQDITEIVHRIQINCYLYFKAIITVIIQLFQDG